MEAYISLNRVGLSLLTTMVMVPAQLRSMSFHSLFTLSEEHQSRSIHVYKIPITRIAVCAYSHCYH